MVLDIIFGFFIFRSGPGFQIWVSNLRFTSYFNSSFNLFLSNCWLLVFDFLQDSAVKPRFWTFFSVNYCFFAQFKFRPGIKFSKSRFRPGIKLFKSRFIWIPGLKQTWNWEAEFQVYFNKSLVLLITITHQSPKITGYIDQNEH